MRAAESVAAAAAFPLDTASTIVDGTATTTPVVLTDDLVATTTHRRVRLVNTGSGTLSLLVLAAGASLTGKTVADGMKLPSGATLEVRVRSSLRLAIVADASCTFNAAIADIPAAA